MRKIPKSLKVAFIIILIVLLCSTAFKFYISYVYERDVESFFYLADQSSTLDKKEEYLLQYRNALQEHSLNEGQARYIFKTPSTDLGKHFELLNILIQRIEETRKLDTKSFEYQKAIEQITEQEFGYFNIGVFFEGFVRQNIFRFIFYKIGSIGLPILLIGLFFLIFVFIPGYLGFKEGFKFMKKPKF